MSGKFVAEEDLDRALLEAHASNDGELLVQLYHTAAKLKAAACDSDAAAFLYTQAYVFALECNHLLEQELRQKLIELGREAPM